MGSLMQATVWENLKVCIITNSIITNPNSSRCFGMRKRTSFLASVSVKYKHT